MAGHKLIGHGAVGRARVTLHQPCADHCDPCGEPDVLLISEGLKMVALNENDATEVSTSGTEGQMRDLLGKVAKSRKQQAQDGSPSANNALPLIAGMAA